MLQQVRALVVREAVTPPRALPFEQDAIIIGRDPDCTLQLLDPHVSRHHARIERSGGGSTLVDLGSRNGLLLNGTRVERSAPIRPGDVVAIADTIIELLAAPVETITTLPLGAKGPKAPTAATADRLQVNKLLYEVLIGGRPLDRRLSPQEFLLLRYLYDHNERVCTRRELGDAVWGADGWDPNMLHRLVHRLKEKLEPSPDRTRYVHTVPHVGYRVTP